MGLADSKACTDLLKGRAHTHCKEMVLWDESNNTESEREKKRKKEKEIKGDRQNNDRTSLVLSEEL